MINQFAVAQSQFDKAAEILNLDEASRRFLREPMREMHVLIPVRMDSGE